MKKLSTVFFLMLMPMMSFAQTGTIKARVIDAKTGEPINKATVQILETKQGAFTKLDGYAVIKNITANRTYSIVTKYPGYMSNTQVKIKIAANTTIILEVKLEEQRRTSCYFSIGASDIPTSISKICLSELSLTPMKIKPSDSSVPPTRGTHCRIGGDFQSEVFKEKERIEFTSAIIKPVLIFPNPAVVSTQVSFDATQSGEVRIMLYDIRGAVLRNYTENIEATGRYTTNLDLNGVPEGVYTVHIIQYNELRTGRFHVTK